MPKFSIIFPAHNSAAFMRKGLDSIRSQTFTDYELIVVCDACDDNSADIASEYTDKVFIVDYHNAGLTRSHGLDQAAGEWVLFMDDDDWWLHEYVMEQLAGHLGDEDLLCFSFIWKGIGYAAPIRENRLFWPAVWNKCWRRSAIGSTRFPAEYPDDLLFHNAMMQKALFIKVWDMPMYYYNYMRPGSINDHMVTAGREPDLRTRE